MDSLLASIETSSVSDGGGGGGQGAGRGQSQEKGKGAGKGNQNLVASGGICDASTSILICDLSGDESPSQFCADAESAASLIAGGGYRLGGC